MTGDGSFSYDPVCGKARRRSIDRHETMRENCLRPTVPGASLESIREDQLSDKFRYLRPKTAGKGKVVSERYLRACVRLAYGSGHNEITPG